MRDQNWYSFEQSGIQQFDPYVMWLMHALHLRRLLRLWLWSEATDDPEEVRSTKDYRWRNPIHRLFDSLGRDKRRWRTGLTGKRGNSSLVLLISLTLSHFPLTSWEEESALALNFEEGRRTARQGIALNTPDWTQLKDFWQLFKKRPI